MKYLIVGGTGTLGKELVSRFYGYADLTVLSRDEFKQAQMRDVFVDVKFKLGNIENKEDLDFDFSQFDTVFHCAALKHVDVGESEIKRFIATNINGTINLADKCAGKSRLVYFSTDKAVNPVNVYGMTKAIGEKYVLSKDENNIVFRWGNILGSRGSIIKKFERDIKNDIELSITHKEMTRFWLTINEAIDFVIDNFKKPHKNRILIPPLISSKVTNLALAIGKIIGKNVKMKYVGLRPGEKIHETILWTNENSITSDKSNQYSIIELENKLKYLVRK